MAKISADAAKPSRTWIKPLARLGYGARGLVYLVVAFFALLTAFSGGENEDTKGAIKFLTDNAAGTLLTIVLIVGLAGYSIWRFIQASFDTDNHGTKPSALAIRAGLLTSGLIYAVLTVYTFSLWWGSGPFGSGSGGGGFAKWVSGVVGARPAAIAGASIMLGVAAAHFIKAAKRKYHDYFDASKKVMAALDPVAIAGLVARGLTFLVLAILLYTHGLTSGKGGGSTPGLKDALDYVLELPAGTWLLGAIGVGLLAFSAYSFAEAWWRRISVAKVPAP